MKFNIEEKIIENQLHVKVKVLLREFIRDQKEYFATKDLVEKMTDRGHKIKRIVSGISNVLANTRSGGYHQEASWVFDLELEEKSKKQTRRSIVAPQKKTGTPRKNMRSRMKKIAEPTGNNE